MKKTIPLLLAAVVLLIALLIALDHLSSIYPVPTAGVYPGPGAGGSAGQVQTSETYRVFLPFVTRAPGSTWGPKGIALAYGYCEDATNSRSRWLYTWGPNPPTCSGGMEIAAESVPMLWDEMHTEDTVGGNSQWVMGFNEPDKCPVQACMTITEVAENWHRIEERFPDRKLLAPVYSQDAYTNTNPIADFRNEYYRLYSYYPRLDGLAAHCYMPLAADCESFITTNYLNRMSEFGASELWVTEFAYYEGWNGSEEGAWIQANWFIDWMATQPQITRYAWFAARIRCYEDPLNCEEWAPPPGYNSPLFHWKDGTPTYYGTQYTVK